MDGRSVVHARSGDAGTGGVRGAAPASARSRPVTACVFSAATALTASVIAAATTATSISGAATAHAGRARVTRRAGDQYRRAAGTGAGAGTASPARTALVLRPGPAASPAAQRGAVDGD